MYIMVAYDPDGNIVNLARIREFPEDIPHPFGDLAEDHQVLSIEEPGEELQAMSLLDVQRQFRVDTETAQLVRQE
jgi:hypothetical protein